MRLIWNHVLFFCMQVSWLKLRISQSWTYAGLGTNVEMCFCLSGSHNVSISANNQPAMDTMGPAWPLMKGQETPRTQARIFTSVKWMRGFIQRRVNQWNLRSRQQLTPKVEQGLYIGQFSPASHLLLADDLEESLAATAGQRIQHDSAALQVAPVDSVRIRPQQAMVKLSHQWDALDELRNWSWSCSC